MFRQEATRSMNYFHNPTMQFYLLNLAAPGRNGGQKKMIGKGSGLTRIQEKASRFVLKTATVLCK